MLQQLIFIFIVEFVLLHYVIPRFKQGLRTENMDVKSEVIGFPGLKITTCYPNGGTFSLNKSTRFYP